MQRNKMLLLEVFHLSNVDVDVALSFLFVVLTVSCPEKNVGKPRFCVEFWNVERLEF